MSRKQKAKRSRRLASLLAPQRVEHWGEWCEFEPVLLNRVFGDGSRLLQVFPINERPRYWVVRVDASVAGDRDVHEIIDEIAEAISDQFGDPNEDDLGVGDERPYFPSCNSDDGFSWNLVRGAL